MDARAHTRTHTWWRCSLKVALSYLSYFNASLTCVHHTTPHHISSRHSSFKGAADRAGLTDDQVILEVNRSPIVGLSLVRAFQAISDAGTVVTLTVAPSGKVDAAYNAAGRPLTSVDTDTDTDSDFDSDSDSDASDGAAATAGSGGGGGESANQSRAGNMSSNSTSNGNASVGRAAAAIDDSTDVDAWLAARSAEAATVAASGSAGGAGGASTSARAKAKDASDSLPALLTPGRSSMTASSRVATLLEPLNGIVLRTAVIKRALADTGLGLQLFSPTATWSNPNPMGIRISKVYE